MAGTKCTNPLRVHFFSLTESNTMATATFELDQDFEDGLRVAVEDESSSMPRAQRRKIGRILAMPKSSPRRKRRLAFMNLRAREHLGKTGAIDWSSVDWMALLKLFLQILMMILAL